MAQLTFFAGRDDVEPLVDFLLAELECHVWESHSLYDRPLRRFATAQAVVEAYDAVGEPGGSGPFPGLNLAVWAPTTGPPPVVERIEFSKPQDGATHRFAVSGWGVFSLDLRGLRDRELPASTFAHNSEKRARLWEDTYRGLGPVGDWDWERVERISRKIRYHVARRLAVRKDGARPVLPHADRLARAGVALTA